MTRAREFAPWLAADHEYLGLDLDEVLEGPEQAPAVYVRDATNTAVTLPPLTDSERAVVLAQWRADELRERGEVAAAVETLRMRGIALGIESQLGPVAAAKAPRPTANPLDCPAYQASRERRRAEMVRRVREAMARHTEAA